MRAGCLQWSLGAQVQNNNNNYLNRGPTSLSLPFRLCSSWKMWRANWKTRLPHSWTQSKIVLQSTCLYSTSQPAPIDPRRSARGGDHIDDDIICWWRGMGSMNVSSWVTPLQLASKARIREYSGFHTHDGLKKILPSRRARAPLVIIWEPSTATVVFEVTHPLRFYSTPVSSSVPGLLPCLLWVSGGSCIVFSCVSSNHLCIFGCCFCFGGHCLCVVHFPRAVFHCYCSCDPKRSFAA